MRIEASVTSISWIPSETIVGVVKAPFSVGAMHYDEPPPDVLENVELLHARSQFRLCNHLKGSIEVEDDRIVAAAHLGRGYICPTRIVLGTKASMVVMPTPFPDVQTTPMVGQTEARFRQTTGGRTGLPLPRRVSGGPHVRWAAPTVWTTLELTIGVDGSSRYEVTGASPFPRHWIYDNSGALVAKTGLASFEEWKRGSFGRHTPWGEEDSAPLVTMAETVLERELATRIMHGGAKPAIRRVAAGSRLFEQGEAGEEIFLLLDGMVSVAVEGVALGDIGPGAVFGERALLEGGRRTATLRTKTACILAVAAEHDIDRKALAELAEMHRREGRR